MISIYLLSHHRHFQVHIALQILQTILLITFFLFIKKLINKSKKIKKKTRNIKITLRIMNSGESEREEKKRIRVGVNEIGAILLSLIFFPTGTE